MKKAGNRRRTILWAGVLFSMMILLYTSSFTALAKTPSASAVKKLANQTVKKETKKVGKKDKPARLEKVFRYADKKFAFKMKSDSAFIEASTKKTLSSANLRIAAHWMLKKRKGTCFHEAAGLAYLIRCATGYPVRVVIGQTNVFSGQNQLHAWVEAMVDGSWLLFDSNVDRGKAGRSLTYFKVPTDGSDERYAHYTPGNTITVK